MGIATSSPSLTGGAGGHSGGDIIRRCNCYSVNNVSLDRKCYRHSLTFNVQAQGDQTHLNQKQKKKRSRGFATFKKILIGKRSHCKGFDHGRYFREHFMDCPSDVLRALLAQYEALTLLKDLSVQADLARPPSMTMSQSLSDLYENEECCDLVLCYRGYRLPVHRSILMARCPSFSRHLSFSHGPELHLRTPNYTVSLSTLKRAVKYLYCGSSDVLTAPPTQGESEDEGLTTLALLQDEFGIPNSLESDMSYLWESGSLGDCKLIFNHSTSTLMELPTDKPALELVCHRTLLASRSLFFRKLVDRRLKSDPYYLTSMMDICLDGDIIPAKYGKVLLHAMYHDTVDLRLIQSSALSQLHVAGGGSEGSEDRDDHAMNLFEIGRFLEFNFLSQSCEDLLVQNLNTNNVVKILQWSLKPHGSAWISRQAFLHIEEEFYSISNSEVLASLDQETLAKVLQSDFIQASEAEILQSLVRWGECQLNIKNSITKDTASMSAVSTLTRRRDTKRREVCESELKELLLPLFPLVRFPHVLPRDKSSEVLDLVLARNLYPVLPNFTSQLTCSTKYSPWDPRCSNGLFVRPRLFIPYLEECKNLIHDRCAPDPELISISCQARDTMHMTRGRKKEELDDDEEEQLLEFQSTKPPDKEMVSKMVDRFLKLLNSYAVQRSLAVNFIEQQEIIHLVELRVVREFNLPDNYVNILRKMRSRDSTRIGSCLSATDLRSDHFSTLSTADLSISQQSSYFRNVSQDVPAFRSLCGPDVTLATSSISSLSLQTSEPDSPDLVSLEGTTTTSLPGARFLKNLRHKRHTLTNDFVFHQLSQKQHQLTRRNSQTSDQVLMSRSLNCPQSQTTAPGVLNLTQSRMYL